MLPAHINCLFINEILDDTQNDVHRRTGLWIDGWEFSQKPLVFIGGYGFPHDVVIHLLGLFRLS
jgi:hypothetical protein